MIYCISKEFVLKKQKDSTTRYVVNVRGSHFLDSPSISADNGTRTVIEGSSLAVHCLIEARPLPSQSQKLWFLNGSPIVESNFNITRVNLSVSKLSTSLHVQHFHRFVIFLACFLNMKIKTLGNYSIHVSILSICTLGTCI